MKSFAARTEEGTQPDPGFLVVLNPAAVLIGETTRIDSFVKIEGGQGVEIGEYVHVCSFVHLNIGGGKVTVGPYTALASGCRILGGTNTPRGTAMSSAAPKSLQDVERKHTIIGQCAMIGAGSTIMPGVVVGDFAVVAAGAIVTHDVPPFSIIAGPAARVVGLREIEQQEQEP